MSVLEEGAARTELLLEVGGAEGGEDDGAGDCPSVPDFESEPAWF